MSFLAEIKRRNVHRVMAAYAAGAWLLVEIMELLTGVYEAPGWVMKVLVALILAGAVPAAIVSWFYELTPHGLRKESEDGPAPPASVARKFNLAILAMLVAAIVVVLLFSGRFAIQESTTSEQAATPDTVQVEGPPMVAVLPFDWASMDGDSEFFANGIHDDLLTQLARLKSLRVISRTSVMEFQGVERNLREIGRILGADAILEGGIQRAGNRIRINAQLIDAETDEHLWANTYDRELSVSNIFDVQTEISRAIAQAMQASLSQDDESAMAKLPTENMAAYRAFHEAMEMGKVHGGNSSEEYRRLLRRAVELDPSFTRAWSTLVGALTLVNFTQKNPAQIEEAEHAIEQIARMAPGSVDHLTAQAYYAYYILREYDMALGLLRQAIALAPSDVELYSIASWVQRRQRDWDGQIESLRKAWELDPLDAQWPSGLSNNLAIQHRYAEARSVIEQYRGSLTESRKFMNWTYSILQIEVSRDLGALLEAMRDQHENHPDERSADRLWEALVANRQFDEAWSIVDAFGAPAKRKGKSGISFQDEARLITAWLMGEQERAEELARPLQSLLEAQLAEHGEFPFGYYALQMAMIKAITGRAEEVPSLFAQWERFAADDSAEQVNNQGIACSVLGMAGLADRTVECLRDAETRPAYLFHYFDPWLPYFDPVRDSEKFKTYFSELEARYGPMKNWP